MSRLKLSVPPYAEPINLIEAKLHCRTDEEDEDARIQGLIRGARRWAEQRTERQLVAATWHLLLDYFPEEIRLPYPPLIGVDSITYVDTNGATQTLASTEYQVVGAGTDAPARVVESYDGDGWPTTRDQPEAVTVAFKAGYVTPFTAVAATDFLTWKGRTPSNGTLVRLSNSGGSLPGGLSTDTDYYVVSQSSNTCKLSLTSGGSAVDITDAGSGTSFIGVLPATLADAMLLLISTRYRLRGGEDSVTDWQEAADNLVGYEWTGAYA